MHQSMLRRAAALGKLLLAALAGAGVGIAACRYCHWLPDAQRPASPLAGEVARALDGHEETAGGYAAFYQLLASRFEAGTYETTTRAARVAGRAADILELPGHLDELVGEQLEPHVGTAGSLSAAQSTAAAAALRELAAACREVTP